MSPRVRETHRYVASRRERCNGEARRRRGSRLSRTIATAGSGDWVFVQSETELTTAATDAVLGILCLFLAVQLLATPAPAVWKRGVWVGVLGLMSCGSLLGAVAHGLEMTEATRALIWKPLYLALGLAVALVVVGAAHDWWGEAVARGLLPWALGVGLFFFIATQLLGGAFQLFIIYEAAATLAALFVYVTLAATAGMPGAPALALGIALSLVAAAVQVSSLTVWIGVRFDHNGVFHLIQMAGVIAIAIGVRASLAR